MGMTQRSGLNRLVIDLRRALAMNVMAPLKQALTENRAAILSLIQLAQLNVQDAHA